MSAHTIEAVLTARDQNFTSTFDKAVKTSSSLGDKIKSGLGFGAFMAIGQKAINGVFSLLSSSVSGAVQRFDTLNNFPKVMQSLGFATEDAKKSIDALGDGITYLPTTLDKVASQTQQVVAVTGDLDQATKLTLALNNAMASGGQSAEQQASAINQWVQAMSKGKPDLQDWRALVQTAPAQMNQLAEATLGAGKTQADLYEAMKDGSVSIDEVNEKMIELSEKGADGITSWADQAKSAGAGIQMSMANVKAGMQRNIANVLESVNQRFEKFGGIAGIIQGLVTPIDAVGKALGNLISGKVSIGDLLTFDVSGILKSIDKGLPQMIAKGLKWAEGFTSSLRTGFGNLVSSGMEILQHIAQGIAKAMPVIIQTVPTIVSNIAGLINDNAPKLVATAFNIIVTLGKGLIKALPVLLANLPKILKSIWDVITAFNWIALGGQVINAIGAGIKAFGTSIPTTLKGIGKNAWNAIKNIQWGSVGSSIVKLIGAGIKALQSLPSAMLRRAFSLAAKAFTSIAWGNVGRNIIKGIVRGVTAGASLLLNALGNLAKRALASAKKALGIHSPSREFAKIGALTAKGFVVGLESMSREVQHASENLVSIPRANAMGFGTNLAYEYGATADYSIEVPLYLNGREIARASAGDMETILAQRTQRANRKVGIR